MHRLSTITMWWIVDKKRMNPVDICFIDMVDNFFLPVFFLNKHLLYPYNG